MNTLTPTLILLFLLTSSVSFSQEKDTIDWDIAAFVQMDSFVVTASRSGFDVADFIEMVRTDESFYAAFKAIRFLSYSFENDITFYDKKGNSKANYQGQAQQYSDGKCREMYTFEELISGNFYKRKQKHRYYTAKLYDRLFFTHGKKCESKKVKETPPSSKMEEYIVELKKLIFQPGEKANVPFIGNKTAIFTPEMAKYYDYFIRSEKYQDQIDCYVFSATVKPEFQNKKEGKTVIKSLETYFDKASFQVVARDYQLRYATAVYDFDVKMKIELQQFNGQYVPTLITYDGQWDIPAKKPEIGKFSIRFWEYH